MQLVIKPCDGGAAFLIELPERATAADAQRAVAQKLNASSETVALSSSGRALAPNTSPLSSFGISNLSTVDVAVSRVPDSSTETPLSATYDDEEEACVICLEGYSPEAGPVTLACRHAFHHICIEAWCRSSQLCPLCRRQIKPLEVPPPARSMLSPNPQPTAPPMVAPPMTQPSVVQQPQLQQQQPVYLVPVQPAPSTAIVQGAPSAVPSAIYTPFSITALAAAAGSALSIGTTAALVPSGHQKEEIEALLLATREKLRGSADWQRIKRSIEAFRSSELGRVTLATARTVGKAAVAATATLASAAGTVGAQLAREALRRNPQAAVGLATAALTMRGTGGALAGAAASAISHAVGGPSATSSLLRAGAIAAARGGGSATLLAAGALAAAAASANSSNSSASPVHVQQQQQQQPQLQAGGGGASNGGFFGSGFLGGGGASVAPAAQQPPVATPVPEAVAPPQYLPVILRCPRCHMVLQAPAGAPIFRCGCGQLLQR